MCQRGAADESALKRPVYQSFISTHQLCRWHDDLSDGICSPTIFYLLGGAICHSVTALDVEFVTSTSVPEH